VKPAARVVPDVASFAVDDGFWYSVPDHLVDDLAVGSIVRVPLSGRRVRGWVVELATHRDARLKDIAGVSGAVPVFTPDLLQSLLWTARHYVAPVSALLRRASPPNLPRSLPPPASSPAGSGGNHPISGIVDRTTRGRKAPVTALVGNWRRLDWLRAVEPILVQGSSVLVIAASVAEVDHMHATVRPRLGEVVVAVDGEDDQADTSAWEAAQVSPRLVIGTPKTAAWQVAALGLVVVVEEGRRAMKDRQTPTIHVRELIRTRSRLEGFNLVFYGPTPSVELLAAGAEVVRDGNRAWPLVEVVDRSEEPPGTGFLSDRTVAAISATVRKGDRVFVFTHRRVGAGSMRCTRCRTLRACQTCGLRLARVERCPRCDTGIGVCSNCGGAEFEEMGTVPERLVSELNRKLGTGLAEVHPAEGEITVGTERDLAGLVPVALAVAADVDGMLAGLGYRTAEEALRQLGRLALAVRGGSGHRVMVQTSRPESMLVATLRRGDPIPYLERVLVERAREGSPPASEMIAVEVRGEVPAGADLGELDGAVVMGPMAIDDGRRWLLTGDLGEARLQLRKLVGRWRDGAATVRVDVDPIDV
jgi:primosomal protein N' (replication factor Y) (superfamily II helicase)